MEVQGFSCMNNSLLASRMIKKRDGRIVLFEEDKIIATLQRICEDLKDIDIELLAKEVKRNIFDGISTQDLEKAYILAACVFIERDPAYSTAASRFLLGKLKREVLGKQTSNNDIDILYRQAFVDSIKKSVSLGYLDQRMLEFDLELLASSLVIERDDLIEYTGMHTLYERYLLRHDNVRLELPQIFWMRIAMGLSLQEPRKNECALEFYELMSSLYYTPSTPTLFHAGFPRAQLSSCYLNTVNDDLGHIFKSLGDNAQLSKWAGGIGTDWTPIRGTGSFIKGIKAYSQGVVPYLKIANDVVVAITKSGIRRGGTCVYLECWHFDVEDFLDLKRNTGDERRRTHDMNTALWIPDLFMKRVDADGQWTLFSPDEAPELHELYGSAFEKKYEEYEIMALEGRLKLTRTISAKQLWRKMLTRLFETGHPWITFKDACNIRSPQDHAGVVHSSNLCTEITLNTSADETAVCNLGSINLERHVENGMLNEERLERTVNGAVRMLDNVIDLNFYPIVEAQNSNQRHRPIGLGLMGFQDALYKLEIPFSLPQAKEFADVSMEKISYFAIRASSRLAQERGSYSTFKGSKWDRGIFPIDTLDALEKERGLPIKVNRTKRLDWEGLKHEVKHHGMRNSNVMAVAPTATISTIAGCYPCIEPIFKNIYVKSNVSGEFTVVNNYLIEDLKKINLWNTQTLDLLKYYDGDIGKISYIPDHLKEKYKTAFEIDPQWLAEITAVRGKWIDQSQSHNVFMQGVSGSKLDSLYRFGWHLGMKTFYYLRSIGASGIEKSTLDTSYGFTQKREYDETVVAAQSCKIEDPTCESCQ
jgi:ribonucleoside-diphosphate reductase alpha chain